MAPSIAPINPPTTQAFLLYQTRKGPRQRRGTRGDTLQEEEKRGAHTTQIHSSLSSPTTLACNSPNHLGTLKYARPQHTRYLLHPTTPQPQPRFLQLGVLQPESHDQLGRRMKCVCVCGGVAISLSQGPGKPNPDPTHTALRSWTQLCKGHSASAWETRGGGWGAGLRRTVNKPRRGGRGRSGGRQRGRARECAADGPDRGRAGPRGGGLDAISASEPWGPPTS